MSELTYQSATKADLWKALQEAQGEQEPDDPLEHACSPQAKKYIKAVPGYKAMFVRPGAGFGVGGVQIDYCPFCGRKLDHA